MSWKRIWAIVLRQYYLIHKNATRLVNIFLWLIFDIIVWGFTTRFLNQAGQANFNFIPVLLGAIILWGFLIRVQQGVILPFLEDMWSGNFLNLFASPIKNREYILGLFGTSITTSAVVFTVAIALASSAFGYNLLTVGLPLLLLLLVLFLFGLALGIITISLILRFGPSAEWFAWIMPFLFSPISGVFYPIATLPHWLQIASKINPLSYVFEGLREVTIQGIFSPNPLIIGAILALIYLVGAYLIFAHTFKVVVKKGLLARFSAE
ncbi:MAG: ABC transporter permease [Patescibacteria group bacterium]